VGVRWAHPGPEVFGPVDDSSYLMMELATTVAEHLQLVVVIV
jgi:TPP-dependent trihydroxycyclohexane-1,2-dione (THcHDO) dehydratase